MSSDYLTGLETPFELASSWGISCELAVRLIRMVPLLPYRIKVISGYRTVDQELALHSEGRPTPSSPELSTHTSCPATGADLWPSIAVIPTTKAAIGYAAGRVGLRWGGGSTPDPETGIPLDWNHVDLGPRS